MKKLKKFGIIIIAAGVLHLFRKVDCRGFGGWCEGEYWKIIIISFALIISGIAMVLYANWFIKRP